MNYSKLLPGMTTILVVALILYFTYLVLQPFLSILLISLIISVFLNPIYEYLLRKLKRPYISAIGTLLLLIVFILTPISFIIASVVSEARGLLALLQEKPTLLADAQHFITQQMRTYGLHTATQELNLQNEALGFLKVGIQNITGSLVFAGSILINMFLVLITTYFFLISKKRIVTYIEDTDVISHHHFQKIQMRTVEIINGVVRGNLFVVATQMFVGIIGFLIFGLPAPILLGMLYGILSLVPAVGALLISIPAAFAIFFLHGPLAALLFIGYFLLTNLLVDNVIAPKIIGNQTKLHQLLIMFSVVGGLQQFGFIGIVLGPVVIALAFVAIEIYKEFASVERQALSRAKKTA
jgi:predicted PurR-regulated permease PerM